MSVLTFDNLASLGLCNEDGVEVISGYLADALDAYVQAFGRDQVVRVSIVLYPAQTEAQIVDADSVEVGEEDEYEHGVAYLLCDDKDKPFAVTIDVCTLPPVELSDQVNDEGDAEGNKPKSSE